MDKIKLYVSGNTNGLSTKVESIFLDAEIELSNRYEVMNAYDLGFLTESMTKENTSEWFSLLRSCDAIYLLDGWIDSNHCIVEKEIMQAMGKEIFYGHPNPINNIFEKTDLLRRAIHEVFGLSFSEIRKKERSHNYFVTKVAFAYYCFHFLKMRNCEIAKILKVKHYLVTYYLKKFDSLYKYDKEFKLLFISLESKIS